MTVKRVALLTAGGYAPCLSSAVGGLIERYTELVPDSRDHRATSTATTACSPGTKLVVDDEVRENAGLLHNYGGSPIGNCRVKLTNTDGPRQARSRPGGREPARGRCGTSSGRPTAWTSSTPSAATTPTPPPLTSLPTCTSTGHELTKWWACPRRSTTTSCRSVSPSAPSPLLSRPAGSRRTSSVSTGSNPQMLIIHEVMGRACGYLTARARRRTTDAGLTTQEWLPWLGLPRNAGTSTPCSCPRWIWTSRPRPSPQAAVHDGRAGNVNIFLSEGAGVAGDRCRDGGAPARSRSAIPSATSSSTRSTLDSRSRQQFAEQHRRRRRSWSRSPATSPDPPKANADRPAPDQVDDRLRRGVTSIAATPA